MHFDAESKIVKFQNPVPCVARTASLGNEFFAKCELLSGKGRQRHELCLALLKGIAPSNQSINFGFDWSIVRDQSDWETWNVLFSSSVSRLRPHDLNHGRKFGSKSKPFELLCCAQVKTFSIYNFCDFLMWILDVWVTQMRKNSKHFWRQNFTFDRKLAFPPSHLLDAKLSKIEKTFNNILREICKNGNWATNWYFLALSVAVNPKYPISSKSWVQFVSWSLPQPTVKVILWSQNEMMIRIWRRNWLDNYLIIIPLFLSPIIML